jgi:hypothetical protein
MKLKIVKSNQAYYPGFPALVKQASDLCIIDPAGTSHVQKKARILLKSVPPKCLHKC